VRGNVYSGVWWVNLREIGHFVNPGLDKRMILKRMLKKSVGRAWMD
jgi:hypothetical protein